MRGVGPPPGRRQAQGEPHSAWGLCSGAAGCCFHVLTDVTRVPPCQAATGPSVISASGMVVTAKEELSLWVWDFKSLKSLESGF